MALPTDIPTLYAWYRAGSLVLNDGEDVTSWPDSSGKGRTLTGAGVVALPRFYANQLAGYPAVEFKTGDQSLCSSAGFNWASNLASHTLFIVYKRLSAYGVGSQYSLAGCPANGGVEGISSGLVANNMRFRSASPVVDVASADFEWHYCCGFRDGATQIGLSVDGGGETTAASAARGAVNASFQIGGNSAGYCDHRIAEVIIYNSSLSADNKDLVNAYLRDKYFGTSPGQQEQVRDALSRRLWLRRRPTGLLEVQAPLWILDADIGSRVGLVTRVGPAPAGAGWGAKKWQMRIFTLQGVEPDPAGGGCKVQLLDRRHLDVLLWDPARTDKRNASARQSGVPRLTKGVGYTFSRQSKAWVENPADPTSLVECAQNERALTQVGEYLEEERTNEITRSSFASGTTGLTLAGTATNGSAIAVDVEDLLFGTETTPNSLRFTAGSPHAAELRATFPVTASILANTVVRVSFDHKTDSGEGLYWRLQRAVDSWFWNDTSGAWQAGTVDNALPTHADRDPADRAVSKAISVGASNTTVTLAVFLQTGGTASRVSHLYHVQIEKGNFPTSRIVCDGAAVTRLKTELSHEVTAALKLYDPALGGFFCRFTPDWSSSDLGSTEDRYLYWMEANGGADHQALYYDASAGAWTFESKVGGSTVAATKAATVTRGTTYSIGCRWTGVEGELDLPPHTISVFVDGVKGTDATSAAPTFTSPETLFRGSDGSLVKHANGVMGEIRVFPHAFTGEEMAALP